MGAIRRRNAFLLATALVAGILLTGCGADGADSQSSPAGGSVGLSDKDAAVPAEAQADSEAQDSPARAPDLSVDQRSIIYRGSLSVRVKEVNVAAAQATGIAATAGGFIGADNRSSGGSGSDTATMQLRVPAAKFTSTVDQLSKLGSEATREISTEDVTEQTVDLDARITVQQARVDSGRKLLAQAKSLTELVMLEKEVATRESDLASLQGKKRKLADLTALSTITVSFLAPDAPVVAEDDGPPGFLSGLAAGWDALLASLKVLLTVLGALLPWVIALGLPLWGVLYLLRRYRRGHPVTRPALAPAGAPLPHFRTGVGPDQRTEAGAGPEQPADPAAAADEKPVGEPPAAK
ncbi:DUF4349 domain-containing protein [Micromonosporaceae bacterium Da 78-11]